ncbi:hypothetical protein BDW75DRAFT_242046 [Aspergillus navahoensis]
MSAQLLPSHSPDRRLSQGSQGTYNLYEAEQEQSLLEQAFGASFHPVSFLRVLFRLAYYVFVFLSAILILVLLFSTCFPSYTRPPPHYITLRDQVLKSDRPGRGNPRNETVFIAASLYDSNGHLARGHWASSILRLIDLLGENNVFLSIYENDSGDEGESALKELDARVPCNKSIVYEHLDFDELPKITIPGGAERVKRIAYLAETRNRALRQLERPTTQFDKLLYLNDVAFDPVDALQLLFSTNINDDGVTHYRAACAVNFINPFKFYDTYATRDLEGYSMGLPFFPRFSDSGSGQSRKDVLAGKDAAPVRSCWGEMVAFDGQFFQEDSRNVEGAGENLPARFRALQDEDLLWDGSECCLIHADIQKPLRVNDEDEDRAETGVYMNPFVRVSYDTTTLSWIWTTRRFEKLYTLIHYIGNHLVGLPWFNARLDEIPGETIQDTIVVFDGKGEGSLQTVERVARHDAFCGRPGLQVVVPRGEGKKGWQTIPMPM